MAARGTVEKEQITNQILEAFPGSFVFGKEIRVPVGDVQIKLTLTCAKENVSLDGAAVASAEPGESASAPALVEPSQEELDEVSNLMDMLNF